LKQEILKILSNSEEYISGEKLSNLCGVSRTAIWKHINNLKGEGYEIDTKPRIGYRLLRRPDALLKAEILANLNTLKWGKEHLYTFEEVDSTNLAAKKLANEGKPEGTVVVAESQLAGKGRLDRAWVSPKGKGIWVSIILRPNILPANAAQITFVIAVGMVKALKKALGLNVQIKWPNDILIDRRKVAGILTEISAEIERVNYIIVGIGVNVNQGENEFPLDFREKAYSLKLALGHKVSRINVLQTMLEEIERSYDFYLKNDFSVIIEEWKSNALTLGQEVKAITGNEIIEGLAVDLDSDGCLIIKDRNNNSHKIIAGDVSVRNQSGSYA